MDKKVEVVVKMEVSAGDYGRMMFERMSEAMSGTKDSLPEHWRSIADEAMPLVEKLLDLNDKMAGGGYVIVGRKVGKKETKAKQKRIEEAQRHDLLTTAGDLEEGDLLWTDGETYVCQDEPWEVSDKTKRCVYIDPPGGGHTIRLDLDEMVLRAPKELSSIHKHLMNHERLPDAAPLGRHPGSLVSMYEEIKKKYMSEDYWLRRADELGI